ncbi:hypothetical protein PAPHI01_2082 [Pancytospora philotis]|nr:hypothetical protein PAPHI01_2082 [Pancytospora philotis]
MRSVSKLTCIAHCLAAPMLHRAGLLTSDDYALVTHFHPHANDSSVQYTPSTFKDFKYEMQRISKPIRGDEPLSEDLAGVCDNTALGYYREWRDQLSNFCTVLLKRYVKESYRYDRFKKRAGGNPIDIPSLANELRAFSIQATPSSVLLRKSYEYVKNLMLAYACKYGEFDGVMVAIGCISSKISNIVKNLPYKDLERFDPATIDKLNSLRSKLEADSREKGLMVQFAGRIDESVLGTAETPRAIDNNFITVFKSYCTDALAHASKIPGRISKDTILHRTFDIFAKGQFDEVEDPFAYIHLVYPELDYEGWGKCWRAIQNQVTSELEALQKHVEEVSICMSNPQEFIQSLIDKFDNTMSGHTTINYPDNVMRVPSLINHIVANEIEVVVERTINQIHGNISENANSNEAALPGEPETPAVEMEE